MGTRTRVQLAVTWTGPVGIILVLVGWMALAGFLPPPSPQLSQSQVVDLWSSQATLRQAGMVLCIWGGALYVPFSVSVMHSMRAAGLNGTLASAQAALGTMGTVFFTLNFFLLAMIPFRAERAQDATLALHDVGMAMTFSPVPPFTFQYAAIGVAVLIGGREGAVFPRWVGYANLWVAVLLMPATLIPFFRSGPVAWNGILSFWIPVAVFVGWYAVMFWVGRRVIRACGATEAEDLPDLAT